MKKLVFFIPFIIWADVYYAKIEPYKSLIISSEINGKVEFVADNKEGKKYSGILLKIDDSFDKIDLQIAKKNYENLKDIYETKLKIYNKIKSLKTKSQIEKDSEKIQLLSNKINMQNAKLKVEAIKDKIKKKTIFINNKFIYKVFVNKGMYINPGVKIAQVFDTSKSKITIFITKEDLQKILKKEAKILVEGKEDFKIEKIYPIADSEFVSNYKIELIGKKPKIFSKIVKVEIQ